jgi:hypothetical protein
MYDLSGRAEATALTRTDALSYKSPGLIPVYLAIVFIALGQLWFFKTLYLPECG